MNIYHFGRKTNKKISLKPQNNLNLKLIYKNLKTQAKILLLAEE